MILQIIFSGLLGSSGFIKGHFENTVPLKLALGGITSGHEQTQLNKVCYFPFFWCIPFFQRMVLDFGLNIFLNITAKHFDGSFLCFKLKTGAVNLFHGA